MSQLWPLAYGSIFYGVLFLLLPLFIRRGPNQGVIRCSICLAVFSMWIFWATVYIAQMHPLLGPRLKNTTLIWYKQAERSARVKASGSNETLATTVKQESGEAPAGEGATEDPAGPARAGRWRTRPENCRRQPNNLLSCCNIPWLPKKAQNKCLLGSSMDILKLTCSEAVCAFREAEWLKSDGKIDSQRVIEYYKGQVDWEWYAAVEKIKSDCIDPKRKYQSIYTNCEQYDIIYCVAVRMLKNGPQKIWSTATACIGAMDFAASCPICPEECDRREISRDSILCEACYTY